MIGTDRQGLTLIDTDAHCAPPPPLPRARLNPHALSLRVPSTACRPTPPCCARSIRACAAWHSGAKFAWLDWALVRRHMLRLQWRSIEHIAHVTVPLLFIAGMKDEIVPPAQMRLLELAAVASPAVEMHKVAEGMHNDTWMKAGPQLVHWLDEFIQKAGRGPTSRAS